MDRDTIFISLKLDLTSLQREPLIAGLWFGVARFAFQERGIHDRSVRRAMPEKLRKMISDS